MSDTPPGEAGWQPDPTGKHDHRYWDGSQWTDNVSDAGVASTDSYAAAAAGAGVTPEPGPTDPTVTEPVTAAAPDDATAAWSSGGPPPPVAAVPVAAGADGGGGGSKKGLLIGGGILAIVAIIVAVIALGGGSDSGDDDVHAQLVSALTNDGNGLSADDADCVADYLVDHVDHDTLAGLDYSSNGTPQEISSELGDAAESCNVGSGGTDSTTTTPSSGDDSTGDSSTGSGNTEDLSQYKDALVQQFTTLGLDDDQADCLADKMIEAIDSGSLNEADAFSNVRDFLSDCDIDPSELGN